jgi:hypothetical protein
MNKLFLMFLLRSADWPSVRAEIDMMMFGRSIPITKVEDQERLSIDGREVIKN